MPRVPIVDSLKTPLGLYCQIHQEEYSKYSPSDFLVTDFDLDGLDLGPLMNYMKEILYDRVEKHIDRRISSKSNRNRSGHRHVFATSLDYLYNR